MDVGERDKVETEKSNEDSVNHHKSRVPSDWPSGGANFANLLMGVAPDGNPIAVRKGEYVSPSPLMSVVDSFGPAPALWDHLANSQSMGFVGVNDHSSISAFDKLGLTRVPGSFGEAGWEAKSGGFIPSGSGVIPHSISQFPADSAFIERAARFSCFSTGNIADMVHPFGVNHPVNAYHQVAMMPQDPHAVFGGNAARVASGGEPQRNEVNPHSASNDVHLSADHRSQEGSPEKLEKKNGGFDDDTKRAMSDKMHSPDGVGQEEPSLIDAGAEPSSAKGVGSKKRKRGGQDTEPEQSQQQSGEDFEDNGKQNPEALPSNKANGENGKQSSQTSDPPKEGYIHVRARRGQATNSHSLAERVRREKISERMKFLQDLVPGCSKVTGKAVMLDEIINYVQSLQRQVEFLSMKLATVNPRLDFNIESLLAKDQMLAARAGPPLGFSPDMPTVYPQLHPSQPTGIQPGLPIIGSSSDALRNINPQLISVSEGYKEHPPQMHLWDGELHNIVQMGFSSNTSSDNQDTNSSLPPGHTKVEL